jgi:segregation and condensation protein B
MSDAAASAELKQVVGALILAAKRPMSVTDLRKQLQEAASSKEEPAARSLGGATTEQLMQAIADLEHDTASSRLGFHLSQVAGGYKFQTDPECGPWIRHLLNLDEPHRLSHPALETLAIIAYRQPITRVDIEAVRGVNVDHVLTVLMEMQLIRIVGRSKLPGRPMLYGTSKLFLEHFGLNSVGELPAMDELGRHKGESATASAQTQAALPSETQTDADEDEDDEAAEKDGDDTPAEPDGKEEENQ